MNRVSIPSSGFSIITLLWFCCLLATCKSIKQVASPIGAIKNLPADSLVQHLLDNRIEADWLSAKARVTFRGEKKTQKANLNIRLRKDSVLWMNVKKLGIEGARILITLDSIYIVDRIHKEYVVTDFSMLQDQYHLPADFNTLQNVILGNPLLLSGVKLTTQTDSTTQHHLASSDDAEPTRDYWLNGWSKVLEKMVFLDFRNNRKVKIEQSDYRELDKSENFSYFRSLNMSSPQSGDLTIEINLSKVEIDVPKTIRFEIPDHYVRIK